MRPDEHKKKRSAQYKKKHGMQDKKPPGSKEKLQDKETQKQKEEDRDSNSEDEDTQESAMPVQASYRRRKVESNWQRYEEPITEDEHIGPTSRGEGFLKLLDSAGAASSQFRFKDEEDWERETDQLDSSYLSIDLGSLATSLSSIPLYERLGLDTSFFTEEEMQCMDLEANIKTEPSQSSTGNTDSHKKASLPPRKVNKVASDTKGSKHSTKNKVNTPKIVTESKDSSALVSEDSEKTESDTRETSSGIEDDLDFLLSLDTPASTASKSESVISTTRDKKPWESKDNESTNKKEEKEDLEDWLDSILD